MSLRSGIFVLVVVAACLFAAESNAQVIRSGLGRTAARSVIGRSVGFPANQVIRFGTRNAGVQFGGGQGFRAGNQRWGAQFGLGNGLQAGRLPRRW